LPAAAAAKLRVATSRKEGRVANGAELEKEHCSVAARGCQRGTSVTLVKEPGEGNFGFSRP
jgi:hypothetical protein